MRRSCCRNVFCTGGCDCYKRTHISSWMCEHSCQTPVTDSMLSEDGTFIKKSCYSGSDSKTRVFCEKGHPMTTTSQLLSKHNHRIALCGGLSLIKSRLMPYSIIPCKDHAKVDLNADSSRESDLGWECSGCLVANAFDEPLCTLSLAFEAHHNWEEVDEVRADEYLLANANSLPDGPLLRHLRFVEAHWCKDIFDTYYKYCPDVSMVMQLIGEFAYNLFQDTGLDPVSGKLYPVYSGGSFRTALVGAIRSLMETEECGFEDPHFFFGCGFNLVDFHRVYSGDGQNEVEQRPPWKKSLGCSIGRRNCSRCSRAELKNKRHLGGGRKGTLKVELDELAVDLLDDSEAMSDIDEDEDDDDDYLL
ncbi:hypothetical protein QBC39DRAFT_20240 [Podospora conica]|nr:hypothetical protein QBC39DRAFT_20240 [Schizothecium conicum]